jgi:hypothetical protein
MRNRRARSYEDEGGQAKRVDKSALRIIAKHSARNDRDVFVLDPKASPERLGNRRKRRA